MKEQEIIDRQKVICQCKGIRQGVFLKHLHAGMRTLEDLRKATGAGSGSCKGKHCTPRILTLLKQRMEQT
jgi:NAD(P)H-nitrite reductase large subunit